MPEVKGSRPPPTGQERPRCDDLADRRFHSVTAPNVSSQITAPITIAPPTAVPQSGGWPLKYCSKRIATPVNTAAQNRVRHPGRPAVRR